MASSSGPASPEPGSNPSDPNRLVQIIPLGAGQEVGRSCIILSYRSATFSLMQWECVLDNVWWLRTALCIILMCRRACMTMLYTTWISRGCSYPTKWTALAGCKFFMCNDASVCILFLGAAILCLTVVSTQDMMAWQACRYLIMWTCQQWMCAW